jgi:hypothetical protein
MAGDVSFTLNNGNLTLTGDGQANGIAIVQAAPNQFTIVGLAQGGTATTVQGVKGKTVSGVTGNVVINMNGGDDLVRIDDGGNLGVRPAAIGLPFLAQFVDPAFPQNLTVNLGDGADVLVAEEMTVGGKLKVDGGFSTSADRVALTDVAVNAIGSFGQALEIDTNGGDDEVRIDFATFGGLVDIDTGSESDFVSILTIDVDNDSDLQVRTQAGDDVVLLFNSGIDDDLFIDAGNGNDLVAAVEVSIDSEVDILMGFGDDTLQIFELLSPNAEFDGGGGNDKLEDAGGNLFGFLDVDNFEVIEEVS